MQAEQRCTRPASGLLPVWIRTREMERAGRPRSPTITHTDRDPGFRPNLFDLKESPLKPGGHRLSAVDHAELLKDRLDVGLGGIFGHSEC